MLKMNKVEHWSMSFLLSHINNENLGARLRLARRIGSPVLQDACIDFMKSAYEDVVRKPVFQQLPAEILLRLLKDDELNISSEEVLFNSLMWWVKPDCEVDTSRLAQLPAFMAEIRWSETSRTFRNELDSREIISTDLPSMKFLHRACMWIENPENQDCPFNSTPRKGHIVLYGVPGKEDEHWVCQSYDPQEGQGLPVSQGEPRFHAAIACVRGRLLLIGGCMLEDSSENATCEVDELDPRTGNWAALEAMMARRTYGHTATTVRVEGQQGVKDEEVIVVCGGRDEQENALASCELYVPPENL
uniref:Kelch-like protein 18 n=1 Tax=Schistocephalus solidus TaxID=70667 RepID=A0A0X3P6N7_SCHSO